MIKHQTKCGVSVNIVTDNHFEVSAHGRENRFDRDQLTELRAIIDQALNTSPEEIEDAAN